MDVLAFIMALANSLSDEEMAAQLSAYIEEHPEAVADISIATVSETLLYLNEP